MESADASEDHLFCLRDLPGIAEIEALLSSAKRTRGKNWQWSDEYDQAAKLANQVSRRTFGITAAETFYVDDPKLSKFDNDNASGNWEHHFRGYDKNNQPVPGANWAELGWDVTGTDGAPLSALCLFHRQLVAVAHDLCGHLPSEAGELTAADAEAVEARLKAEAAAFRRK